MDKGKEAVDYETNEEIQLFRNYLRIPSVHPGIDYEPCLKFLHCQACCMDLPMRVYYPVNERNPVVIISHCGTEPGKKSILLNSHMDVVAVFPDNWTHKPFAAEMDKDGKIYGRGAQDMKCVGMQYLAAIRALKREGAKLKRTIHISFVPDEEMGGKLGMRAFVQTKEFRDLNVGFALDEGMASPTEEYPVFYAERSVWRIYFKICGTAGHGSLLMENTAAEKLQFIMNKMMELRQEEAKRLASNPELTIGDVTTVNLTRINGGVQSNVIPAKITACFDVRLALDVNLSDFEAKLNGWCQDAGGDITIEYEQKRPRVEPTKLDETNPYWLAFKEATDEMRLKIKLQIFNGGTDSRYIRELGIPALGFSPMANTPVLLHDNDEYLAADVYLKGIEIYKKILPKLANAQKCCCAKNLAAEKEKDKTDDKEKYPAEIKNAKENASYKPKEQEKDYGIDIKKTDENADRVKGTAKEEIVVETKDEPRDELKDETRDQSKDEPKDEPQDERKDETKDEAKDERKDESKDELKDESKDDPKYEPEDQPKSKAVGEPKDEQNDELKSEAVNEAKDEPKDEPKDELKDEAKEVDEPKEVSISNAGKSQEKHIGSFS